MLSDFRFALRQLIKAPGFTATVIATLALGIGACTVMFSVVNTVLLNFNPLPEFDRIVRIAASRMPDRPESGASVADFSDWQQKATSFEAMTSMTVGRINLTGGDTEPMTLLRESVGENSQPVFKRPMALGRWFLPGEYKPGEEKVVVLAYEFWQRFFGGKPDVLGRQLQLNNQPHVVVGVAAPTPGRGFRPDVAIPLLFSDQVRANRAGRNFGITARLKQGVTLADAQTEMDVIAAQLAQQYPDTNRNWGVKVILMADRAKQNMGTQLWTMMAAVVCVLLIGCANIANLQLVRATARQREISIRAALGAGRARLARQLLSESLVLALLGGMAGLLLAHWGTAAFRVLAPPDILRNYEFQLDGGMMAFALALSAGTGLLFGLAPAWLASHVDLNRAMNQGSRGSTEGGARGRLRSTMVALQIGCAVVLLSGAGLFLRSFNRLANADTGFVPQHAIGMTVFVTPPRYAKPEQVVTFVDDVLTRLRTLPGVQAAGATLQLPINASQPAMHSFDIAGRTPTPRETWPTTAYYTATPDYFKAAGLRLLAGREFTSTDTANSPRVVIINQTLARRFFGDKNPMGERIALAMAYDGWREIVGVVPDIKQDGLSKDSVCQIYEPNTQGQFPGTSFIVRYAGEPAVFIPLIKQQVYAVDKNQPIHAITTMEDQVDANIATPRFITQLVAVFCLIALVIATVGIYGVMAYSVNQRTTEIGIRMALGASSRDVLQQVLGQGMKVVGVGLALGLLAALALSRLIAAMLYNTSPRDPVAFSVIMILLAVVSLFACWFPARRGTQIDPLVALRAE